MVHLTGLKKVFFGYEWKDCFNCVALIYLLLYRPDDSVKKCGIILERSMSSGFNIK